MDNVQKTHDYILSHWKQAIVLPKDAESPHMYVKPFLPPCIDGPFKNLYYWDTFFTNKGLLADGLIEEAKNNTENLIHAVNLKGFVPNALSDHMSKFCSQPPYLHFMISDVYNAEHDDEWLEKAYSALKKEYAFWQRERMTATGLNRHYHHPLPKKELIDYYDVVAGERLKLADRKSDEEKCSLAEGFIAVAESGMDWTPRFGFSGDTILPVDLNANLYALEKHLAVWAKKFEPHESSRFEEAAEKRKRLAEKYFLAADGLYYDYNYATGKRSSLRCSAQFFPFVVGLLRDKAAFLRILFHGLTVCSAWKKRNKKRCISGGIPIVGHPIIFWRMPRQKPWARKKQRNESRFVILKRCPPSLKKAADSGKNTTPSAAA